MPEYRWNQHELAAGYDAAAEHIHPHYRELQTRILELLPFSENAEFLAVDLGGGSGRLAERILNEFSRARVVVIDQSAAFLEIAARRMAAFGDRGMCLQSRLQDDWDSQPSERPNALVSMSAIHHLEPAEKKSLYGRCAKVLLPGGVFLNGDEVRPESDTDYLAECRTWAAHMHRVMDAGEVPEPMCDALRKWEERNVTRFGALRKSGDDCHETAEAQLKYFREAGFAVADLPWQRQLWAVLRGVKLTQVQN